MDTHGTEQPAVVALEEVPVFSDAPDTGAADLGPVVALALSQDNEDDEDDDDSEDVYEDEQAVVVFDDEPEPPLVEVSEPKKEPAERAPRKSAAQHESLTIEKYYSSSEVAKIFFRKSLQWLYWGHKSGVFVYADGTPIEPIRIGKGQRRRYTLPIIREMALAQFRRGNLRERGYWEAYSYHKGTKYAARADTMKAAEKQFREKRGHEPDKVEYVDGLVDILSRIKEEEAKRITV